MGMVDWIKINTPANAFFMIEQGDDLVEYYAHRRIIFIPPGDLNFILRTIFDLGVNYLIIDTDTIQIRQALKSIFNGEFLPPGFALIYKNYITDHYEVNEPALKIHIYTTGQ